MAKKSQIKNVLIKTKTEGSKEALAELNSIDDSIGKINASTQTLVGNSRSIAKAFAAVHQATRGMDKSSKSILEVGKSLNKAFSGNVKHTKGIDSYATNIEFLQTILQDFNETAVKSNSVMTGLNKSFNSSPLSSLSNDLTTVIGLLQEMVEGMDELNIGTRISNKRLKQARDYIADVGESSDLSAEQMQELAMAQRTIAAASEKSSGSINKYNNGLRRMNERGRSTTKGFSDIVFGSNPLVNAYAAIAVNVYAASEAFRILNEAASFDRLQEQIASFSAGVSGINVRDLAADLQEASGYALTFKEAINLSTQGTAFNFTSDQMKKLTDLTRKASVALGRDFSDSMDRVTKGIAKQEIEVLDEIGVVTRLETAFGKYAATVGKSVDKLTEYERQVALTNEVMEQLEKKYNGIDAQATTWEKLSANIRNVTQQGLSFTQKFLTPAVGYFNTILEQATRIPNAIRDITVALEDQKKTFNIASDAGNYAQAISSAGGLGSKLEELRFREAQLTKEMEEKNNKLAETNVLYRSLQKSMAAYDSNSFTVTGAILSVVPDTDYESIKKDEEELAIIRKNLNEGTVEYRKQLELLATKAGVKYSDVTELTGQRIKAFSDNLVDAERNVSKLAAENTKAYGSFATLVTEVDKMILGSEGLQLEADAAAKSFQRLSTTLNLDSSISSIEVFKRAITSANDRVRSLASDLSKYSEEQTGAPTDRLSMLTKELQLMERIQADNEKLGKAVSAKDAKAVNDKVELLNLQVARAREDAKIADLAFKQAESAAIYSAKAGAINELASVRLEFEIASLNTMRDTLKLNGRNTQEVESQLRIAKAKLDIARTEEAIAKRTADLDFSIEYLRQRSGQAAGNERTQVVFAQEELDLKRQKIELIQDEIEKQRQLMSLGLQQGELDARKNAAPARDAASAFGQLQGLGGLSDLQQGGLQIGESLSTAFANAAEAGKEGFSGMVSYLSENSEAFTEMSMGLANAAGSMFQSITKNKIDGIDREIEAEKRRDGKSAESLAKIKKLEANKIKEQAKASKAQVIMSTSVAIMRAFQDMGIFGAGPAAIMAGLGAMQISQINAAANGQLAALNSGGSGGMTITGGERDNKVDVSSRAQSGESAFYGGMSNNLPGRSGGGRQEAGDAVVLGEVGPEIFIPDVPGTVVPSGRATNAETSGMSMSIQINAIDSASLIERIDEISETIYENVEKELRARNNSSLDNIG